MSDHEEWVRDMGPLEDPRLRDEDDIKEPREPHYEEPKYIPMTLRPAASVRVRKSSSVATLMPALAAARAAMSPPRKDSRNPNFGSRYVSIDALLDAVMPPLTSAGIMMIQVPSYDTDAQVASLLTSFYFGDEYYETEMSMPVTKVVVAKATWDKGRMVSGPVLGITPNAIASVITYLRRYVLAPMVGMAADVDDDGAAASGLTGHPPDASIRQERASQQMPTSGAKGVSQSQMKRLFAIARQHNVPTGSLKDFIIEKYKIENSSELTRTQYDELCDKLLPNFNAAMDDLNSPKTDPIANSDNTGETS